MKYVTHCTVVALAAAVLLADKSVITVMAASADESPHAYFEALVARSDHWKSYSLRSQHQLGHPKHGGYATSNDESLGLWVTYDPANDDDPRRQDAAKVVVPAFSTWRTEMLVAPVGAGDLVLPLADGTGDVTRVSTGVNVRGMTVKVGNEYMTAISGGEYPLDRATGLYRLESRGSLGSTPQAHPAGTPIQWAVNSLPNQVRVPLETTDGHTYLLTWDGYWTDSYLHSGLSNHKAFQLSSGGDGIWLETQTRFNGGPSNLIPASYNPDAHIALVTGRSYNREGGVADWSQTDGNYLGPGVVAQSPLQPMAGQFLIHANRWTRFWVRIVQRANDYDLMDMWMSDALTGPVQLYSQIPLSVRTNGSPANQIVKFWLEFNTSTSGHMRGNMRDLVAYVRNVVLLRDPPANLSGLLVRPEASIGSETPSLPLAPDNLRVVVD